MWAFLIKICPLSVVVVVVIVVVVVLNFSHFYLLLQSHWVNFNQTLHNASLGEGAQVCSNEGPCTFPRGDDYEIAKIHWQILKIFFSRTTGLISAKLGTMHPLVKGTQICSNEGPHPFPRGDNYEIAKIHWRNKNIFFSKTTGPISTRPATVHPRVKEI